jgi:hypothetical protein
MSSQFRFQQSEPVGGYRWVFGLTLLALILLSITPSLLAERASVQEMNWVANNWLTYVVNQQGSWEQSTNPIISSVDDLTLGDTLLAKVYSILPSGYIVVPVMKELAPVKVYSLDSKLNVSDPQGFPVMLRENLTYQMHLFNDNYGSIDNVQPKMGKPIFTGDERSQWDRFAVDPAQFATNLSTQFKSPLDQVGPLLTSVWHQGYPYNMLCPTGYSGTCVVGCVATAMAQIMNYWKKPASGNGTHTYYWGGDNATSPCLGSPGATLTADYSDPYDWANMLNNVTSGSSAAAKNAVAELNYEAGVAVSMMYGSCASGAYSSDMPEAMVNHFKYDNTIISYARPVYNATSWFNLIKTEIDAGRPIYMQITDHAIVIDGWNNTGGTNRYHINYGWADGHTTWYAIDNYFCDWGCSPNNERIFTRIQTNPDWDGDGVANLVDNCPWIGNANQLDSDHDGIGDACDNCPLAANHSQADQDADSLGDACDPDIDNDGVLNAADNCDFVVNPGQEASDADTLGDACDNCPTVPNNDQFDDNGDGIGDLCDGRIHIHSQDLADTIYYNRNFEYSFHAVGGTGVYTWSAVGDIPYGLSFEEGTSGRLYGKPNYSYVYVFGIICTDDGSPAKADTSTITMTVVPPPYLCGDADHSNSIDISDAVYMISYIFSGGPAPNPYDAGDANCDRADDISDAVYMISHIFSGGPIPCAQCK